MSRKKMSLKEKRAKNNARMKAKYKNDSKFREYQKGLKLQKAYNITYQDYKAFVDYCDNKCTICSNNCPSGRALAVDHDHSNGVIRGLLCINCNKGLGNFKDNVKLLQSAIDYLNWYEEALKENYASHPRQIEQSISA